MLSWLCFLFLACVSAHFTHAQHRWSHVLNDACDRVVQYMNVLASGIICVMPCRFPIYINEDHIDAHDRALQQLSHLSCGKCWLRQERERLSLNVVIHSLQCMYCGPLVPMQAWSGAHSGDHTNLCLDSAEKCRPPSLPCKIL